MKVDRPFEYKRFTQAKDGALLIAVYGDMHVVRGIKTVSVGDDGDRKEFFVTVGPFVPEEQGYVGPTAYTHENFAPGWVLELSDDHVIVPSPDPAHICDRRYIDETVRGSLLIGEAGVFLAAEWTRFGSQRWRLSLWNIATGHLYSDSPDEQYFIIKRWKLVRQRPVGDPEVLFKFPEDAPSDTP